MLIPFLQRLSDSAPVQVTQQKELREENAALKHEINSMREDILALRAELQNEKDERERLKIQLLLEQSRKGQAWRSV
jgi:Skp family chaperone for outer membrane proteins